MWPSSSPASSSYKCAGLCPGEPRGRERPRRALSRPNTWWWETGTPACPPVRCSASGWRTACRPARPSGPAVSCRPPASAGRYPQEKPDGCYRGGIYLENCIPSLSENGRDAEIVGESSSSFFLPSSFSLRGACEPPPSLSNPPSLVPSPLSQPCVREAEARESAKHEGGKGSRNSGRVVWSSTVCVRME